MKKTKKATKKVAKKEIQKNNIDDGLIEIVIGCLFFSISDFNDGNILEKIIVLFGFVILMVGICRLLPKYKAENKKGMIVLLSLMGLVAIITFIGLLLRLFGVL